MGPDHLTRVRPTALAVRQSVSGLRCQATTAHPHCPLADASAAARNDTRRDVVAGSLRDPRFSTTGMFLCTPLPCT